MGHFGSFNGKGNILEGNGASRGRSSAAVVPCCATRSWSWPAALPQSSCTLSGHSSGKLWPRRSSITHSRLDLGPAVAAVEVNEGGSWEGLCAANSQALTPWRRSVSGAAREFASTTIKQQVQRRPPPCLLFPPKPDRQERNSLQLHCICKIELSVAPTLLAALLKCTST